MKVPRYLSTINYDRGDAFARRIDRTARYTVIARSADTQSRVISGATLGNRNVKCFIDAGYF